LNQIFHPKNPFTIGLELEVRLIDKNSMSPANKSPYIFEHLPPKLKPHIHKELLKSMIEIVTPVCESASEATDFIMNALFEIAEIGKEKNIVLAALATHPFERKEDNERFDDPRYDAFAKELQIVLKNFLISGLHIHIAMPDEHAAINSYNHTIHLLPLFLALSASSPFHLGEDTGLQSYRSKIFERLPRAGIPEYFESYKEYMDLTDQLFETGTIKSVKDIWWDVRIHQKFGTVELRVCDAFYNKTRLKLLTLLYRATLIYYSKKPAHREPYQISKQNKWNAVRHGLNGKFIEKNRVMTIREKLHILVNELKKADIFKEIDAENEIAPLHELIDAPAISEKMRELYSVNGSLDSVIREEIVAV